jgi:hypothetical protein
VDEDMTQDELEAATEHSDLLLNIRAVLATNSGRGLFKYLFKHLNITELPEIGVEGQILFEQLGFLRASNAIFAMVAEADPVQAADILAKVMKEKHEKLYAEQASRQGV